ncbi:acyl-CoA dehydrogenase family protein [Pseudooceanicola sp. C21-150M6]|uniref:acyl-CoA dehydrogenase family protein n=1 Tax=Pseudooceanicola sp. C21-150M6 TaxID=3434355 RepID=UPI003D7F67CE
MNFDLTEDRQMLQDTLRRYLADKYGIEHRNKVAYAEPFHDPAKWGELTELGALFALAPEEAGGMGGAGFDIAVVFEELGRTLCPEPVLGALMASRLLTAAGADQEELLAGSKTYAVGLGELDAPYDLTSMTTTVSGGKITGRKSIVYGGQDADAFLIAAKEGDSLSVYEVAASDASVTGYALMDGAGAAEVVLENAPATLILSDAGAAIDDAINAGILALCSEAVGAMDVLHAMTVDYLGQRKQFGRPIGTFQVLQHRAVDMLTEIEQSRSIVIKAAAELGGPDAGKYCSMAKNLIGRAGRLVAEEAIQMHGGIAMTWEYPGSHYAKRIIMIDAQLGDTDYHLARVAQAA